MGEYYNAPELEQLYAQVPQIDQICIHGDEQQNVVIAIVVPTFENVTDSEILENLQSLGQQHEKKAFEIPVDVIIANDEWTADNGFLTVSLKIKRKTIAAHFEQQINEIFAKVTKQSISS